MGLNNSINQTGAAFVVGAEEKYAQFVHRIAMTLCRRHDLLTVDCNWPFNPFGVGVYIAARSGCKNFNAPIAQVATDIVDICECRYRSRNFITRTADALESGRQAWVVAIKSILFKWKHPAHRFSLDGFTRAPVSSPVISVIMLSYNRLPYLRNALGAFWLNTRDSAVEIIAVDNGSTDGSAEFLEHCVANGIVSKFVRLNRNLGTSGGYNCGLAQASRTSRFFMKLDSDICILDKSWVKRTLSIFANRPDIGIVALNQINHPELTMLPVVDLEGEELFGDLVAWPCGSAMIFSKATREALGDFLELDSLLYAPDDIDYCARGARVGVKCYVAKGIQTYHQTFLDESKFREYEACKPYVESYRRAAAVAAEYDSGKRGLRCAYDHNRENDMRIFC